MAPRYMHSRQFADLPAPERAAHHVTALHDHEVGALAEIHGRTHFDDLPWRRRRIEGHAIRAVVAMLEALLDDGADGDLFANLRSRSAPIPWGHE